MSITERDIKVLRRASSKSLRLTISIIAICLIPLLILTAALNLQNSKRLAAVEGLTMSDVFLKWTEGFSPSAQYSGKLLIALERLETALRLVGLALFLAIIFWGGILKSKRNARILKYIEESKGLKCRGKES